MKPLVLQVAFAACIPYLVTAKYKDAFVVEFEASAELSPDALNSQIHTSLAASGLDCTASKRYHFTHSLFQGASFDLNCQNEKVAPKFILQTLQSIDGVKKAWPVTSVKPIINRGTVINRGNYPGPVQRRNIKRELEFHQPRDLSQLDKRDDEAADRLSTHVDTGVARLHAASVTGSGIRIAVVDTGFDVEVPGLSKVDIAYAHDLTDNDNDVSDNCSFHGTHVLGIVGAKGDQARYGVLGVAPDASYELYRIQACGESTSTDVLISAFLEAAGRGADIISCSFEGGQAFPEEAGSAVATRLFRNGTYVSFTSGNGGPQVFSGLSPAMADAITSVGSTDNTVTPYLTWQGNWTSQDDGGDLPFVPGLPFDLPSDTYLTIWSPNQNADVTSNCQPLPEPTDLPKDTSKLVLLLSIDQCYADSTGAYASITDALRIPYVIYYTPKNWTVSDGPGFYFDGQDPALKAAVTIEYEKGVKLLEAFHKDSRPKVYLPSEASVANISLENRPNNRTGNLASDFSSWGPTLTGASMPIMMAPGGNIISTFPSKYGGYGVVGGMGQSVPFEAGVAALVKQRHPEYTTEDIQSIIATTARPLKWNDGKGKTFDVLAPVFQQGGGLLDAWNAVHSTTVLSKSTLSFNDTANRPKELSFSIKNTGTAAITYQLSHNGAGSGYVLKQANGYSFSEGEANPVYAEVSINPSTVKVEPGQSASVAVAVAKNPDLPDASTRVSFFGGYIAIEAEGSSEVNKLSLPYTGFGAPLATIPIINRDGSYLLGWNITSATTVRIKPNRTFVCSLNITKNPPASFPDNLFPGVWIDPVVQTRNMSISIVDAESDRVAVKVYQSSSDQVWGAASFWYWDGSDDNKAFIPSGTYVWRVTAQRLNADPSKDGSWDVYDAGPWVLRYAANSTAPA